MSACPDNDVLSRLIADMLSADEQQRIDAHISTCSNCRRRLDDMNDVAGLSHLLQSGAKSVTESARLRVVMDGLRADTAMLNGHCPTVAIPGRTRGSLPQLQSTTKPGFIGRFGDIDIRRVIGRGGMGVVYEGFDTTLDRTVAVKMLSPHLLEDPEAKNRFLREAKAAAALSHESIVTIHAVTESEGMPALVLQYVPGESLADRMGREGKLPFDDVVRIGIQVAKGLAAAHEYGLVHRDIKPGNILLGGNWEPPTAKRDESTTQSSNRNPTPRTEEPNSVSRFPAPDSRLPVIKIADFGLAKRVGNESLTQEGVLAGTPAYMSPEQASDGTVDARSDLFSLGVVLYHISCGKLPFPAESPFVLLDQIRTLSPRPLREINSDLPEWFCSIVHRLLEKKPENRIGSASELAELLERQTAVTPVRRYRRGWIAAVVVIGLLASGGAAAIFWPRKEPVTAPQINGFVVDGAAQSCATLAEAVAAASDNSIIEIHGNGPYYTNTVRVEGKNLTIRAAPGSTPKFTSEFRGKGGPVQFLTSNSDLVVEGLEIDWPNPAPPLVGRDDSAVRCVVGTPQGKLTINRCAITCGDLAFCVGTGGSRMVHITNSRLFAPGLAACLGWRPSNEEPLVIRNCLFDGHIGLFIGQWDFGASPAAVVENSSFVNDRMIRLACESQAKHPIHFDFRHNVCDSQSVLSLFGLRNFAQYVNNANGMIEVAKKSFDWKETGNVYRKDTMYLVSNRPNFPNQVISSRIRKLDQWLEFWDLKNTQSIDGAIRRDDRGGLIGVEGPSGQIPDGVGVNGQNVGPGSITK